MAINNRDTHTILSSQDGIVFATQREWCRLKEDDLHQLDGYTVISQMVSTGSVYFLMRYNNPMDWSSRRDHPLLIKITTNEDTGRVDLYQMELTADEAELIRNTPIPLWE